MISWLKSLFARKRADYVTIPRHDSESPAKTTPALKPVKEGEKPRAIDALEAARKQAEAEKWRRTGVGNLDEQAQNRSVAAENEYELIARVARRIEERTFDLPQLPATQMAAMNMAGDPNCEINSVVELISTDPVLSSELLRIANSPSYSKEEPAETLHEAVMRLGTRVLRSMIYTVSIRGSVVSVKGLKSYSEEIWRQAFMVGNIAKTIAPKLNMEPEKAFLLGLLHDVGKIVLLSILKSENVKAKDIPPSTLGRIFFRFHERAGGLMAESWKLSPEITSVIQKHHDFANNPEHPKSAALVSLAHRMDLHLSTADEDGFMELVNADEFEFLGIPMGERQGVLSRGRSAYQQEFQRNRKVA